MMKKILSALIAIALLAQFSLAAVAAAPEDPAIGGVDPAPQSASQSPAEEDPAAQEPIAEEPPTEDLAAEEPVEPEPEEDPVPAAAPAGEPAPEEEVSTAATVTIDQNNIPDPAFRQYIIERYSATFDPAIVKKINVSHYWGDNGVGIKNLIGLELFPELVELYVGGDISVLVPSGNPKLKILSTYGCASLTHLDVSQNPLLERLECWGNGLTSLNLSGNPALLYLEVGENNLTSLDISNNPKLHTVYAKRNNLTSVNLNGAGELSWLKLGANYLTSLDISNNPKLRTVSAIKNKLTSVNLTGACELSRLELDDNQLTQLDVSTNTELTYLYIRENNISTIDLSKNVNLETFSFTSTPLSWVDLSKCPKLSSISKETTINVEGVKQGENALFYMEELVGAKQLKNISMDTSTLTPNNGEYNKSSGKVRFNGKRNTKTLPLSFTYTYKTGSPEGRNYKVHVNITKFNAHSVQGVKLNKSSLVLSKPGKTYTLKASIDPYYADNRDVKWTSSKTSVAKVSKSGKVTAKKKGKATITAKTVDGGHKATCKVYVGTKVTGVKLNRTVFTLSEPGKSYTLRATVKPSGAINKTVKWSSSKEDVATVSSKGEVKAVAKGKTTVTAKTQDGGKKATCKVYVGAKAKGVSLNRSAYTLTKEGKKVTLKATVAPADAANKTVKWSSSKTSVATVSSKGTVKAVKKGRATITATTQDGGYKATCKIYVGQQVTSLKLNRQTANLGVGRTLTLKATVKPSDALNKKVLWTSGDKGIATVNSKGVVTGKAAGNVVITAKTQDRGKKMSCTVTVK